MFAMFVLNMVVWLQSEMECLVLVMGVSSIYGSVYLHFKDTEYLLMRILSY